MWCYLDIGNLGPGGLSCGPLDNSDRERHADLQSKALLSAVEFQQILSTPFRRLHGAAESRVKQDESWARHEVDEDDAEPEVDVEVDMHVFDEERCKVDLTSDDRDVAIDERRQLETLDAWVHEARQLRQQRRDEHADNHLTHTHTHRQWCITNRSQYVDGTDERWRIQKFRTGPELSIDLSLLSSFLRFTFTSPLKSSRVWGRGTVSRSTWCSWAVE